MIELFILMSFAAYRVTRLVTLDKITEGIRDGLTERAERVDSDRLPYFITCPWCVGFYVSAGVVALTDVFASVPLPALHWIAMGAVVGLIGSNLDG